MELSIDLHNIEKGLHDLFKYAFKQNCDLDGESITSEESKTLEELDSSETLENFKDLVLSLLKFKKEFKTSDKAELAQRSDQLESLLQKLEAEVRTHIRVQHQLKLHIENTQQRIDDLEKTETNDKQLIRSLEEKFSKKQPDQEKIRKEFDEKLKNFLEIIEKKDKILQKNEIEISKLRTLLEEKIRECENVKKELVKLSKVNEKMTVSASIELIKKKWNAKNIQQSLKDRSDVKSERKSMGDGEVSKMSLSPYLKKEVVTIRKDLQKSSTGRTHGRSNSEQKILTWKRF
jgi:DNA repair exonuclease SbcCD ATPase subunit